MRAAVPIALLLLASCAHAPGEGPLPPPPVEPPAEVGGVWEWVHRADDQLGNQRLEQEEWHLRQQGTALVGHYDRVVTTVSMDEQLFKCNGRPAFTRSTRVRVAGTVEGRRVRLKELSFQAKPGPCDDGARNLVSYEGELGAGVLRLAFGPGVRQTLHRREGVAPTETTPLPAAPEPVAEPAVPIDGVWTWELRSVDAEGDRRSEREEWHLQEGEQGIVGYYDRVVLRARDGGSFSCNGNPSYENTTRYRITGQRSGDRLTLVEVDYTTTPAGCDNGRRRLDRYTGTISRAGDELVLSWGGGNQLLRRRR